MVSPRRAASRLGGQGVVKVFQCYYFLLMLSPQSLTAKTPNFHAFCLLYPDSPTKHVHMELCDWLKHLRVTPSSHFFYLSARKSWLETFILDEAIVEVSPPALTIQTGSTACPTFCGTLLGGPLPTLLVTWHCLMAHLSFP